MRTRQWWWFCVAWWLFATAGAPAQQLSLITDATAADPARLRPGGVSDSIIVSVDRTGAVDTADFVSGWQATLELVAEAGSIGSLSFTSAALPQAGYVFESAGSLRLPPNIVNSGSGVLALDSHFPFAGGAEVSPGTRALLLELTIKATPDAYGSFGLYAIPGLSSSEWSDASQPDPLRREFSNVRDNEEPVRIGDIRVTLPGDFNADGFVNAADYTAWRDNFGAPDESRISFAGDGGGIGGADYAIWRSRFGDSRQAPQAGLAISTPEPSTALLTSLFGTTLILYRRSPVANQ